LVEKEECPKCHIFLNLNGQCTICGYSKGFLFSKIKTQDYIESTSTSSEVVTTGSTIPLTAYTSNERFIFCIGRRQFKIENLDENMNEAFRNLHEKYFEQQNKTFDWNSFTLKSLRFFTEYQNDHKAHDNFFNNFTIISNDLMKREMFKTAIYLWESVLQIAYAWENENKDFKLHKGTPYFFLGRIYRIVGDLDFAFLYVYNALKEDERSFPDGYKERPAYMYASLVDDNKNIMYDYVLRMKKKMEDYINQYQSELGSGFSYIEFERKFLQSGLEDIKHFFIYNLELLIKYEGISVDIFESDFTKLKFIDLIFNMCLIVDKVLDNKLHKNSIGENIIELIVTESWGRKPIRNRETFSELLSFDPRNDSPDKVVPNLMKNQESYDSKPMSQIMSLFILVWYLRNFGGHNIRAVDVFHSSFKDIIKSIFYALFFSIEIT